MTPDPTAVPRALERLRSELEPVAEALRAGDMPAPAWAGKLIRPLVGYAGAVGYGGGTDGTADIPSELWRALAAVQTAHEASLIHDDVIDGADHRRGRPTVAMSQGVAAAIVEGDHLLTTAYRLAADTGHGDWIALFARAVERTVAGEKEQALRCGGPVSREEYESIVLAKSGELLGAALAAGPMLRSVPEPHRWYDLGRRLGLCYQMLDDFLDYCPHVETGKPSLIDYRRGLWTWPRLHVELPNGLDRDAMAERLGTPDENGDTPLDRLLAILRSEMESVLSDVSALMPEDRLLEALMQEWLDMAEEAVALGRHVELPPVAGWEQLMAEHAKSFRFASRLFPAEYREQVTGVYAWCRYTDDLVDESSLPVRETEARLDAWLRLSRRAYEGEETGNVLADRVMGEMSAADVPFGYAEALIEGQRMDLRGTEYGTLAELWTYTYRVASVVGLWMTELFGIRDPWMLDRAASLGHAMQLTNILRDVGEDLAAGRVYIPGDLLAAYDLTRDDLERMATTGAIDDRYRDLIERMIQIAEAEYDHAAPAVDRLPDFYRRPVAVASDVYRGIHEAIRDNDYDNLTTRAYTTLLDKLRLGAGALLKPGEGESSLSLRSLLLRTSVFGMALALAFPLAAGGQVGPGTTLRPADTQQTLSSVSLGAATLRERALRDIGELWILAVENEEAVDLGLGAIDSAGDLSGLSAADERLLKAYRGSFVALRAKHGGWPGTRWRHLKNGQALMDEAVAEAPDQASVRYIRLMSGFYLPGFFGRGDEVAADLEALVQLLPDARSEFPAEVFPVVVEFVLEHGDPDPAQRAELQALLS